MRLLLVLKSAAIGLGCGVAATLFWLLALAGMAAVGLPLTTRTGGGAGTMSVGLPEVALFMAILGFAWGFGWMLRRSIRLSQPT